MIAPLVLLAALAAPAGPRVEPVPLGDVRLLDGPFLEMQRRGLAALLALEPDRLLHAFRLNAGLPTTAKPYGGWEAPSVELRGHTLGHYLTACALMHEATGDERPKARALAVVAELVKVERALAARGATPGYLSAFPEELFDRVEARRPVWAPYYTLHKILAGLLDVHRVTGDGAALGLAKGMASWVGRRASRLDEAAWQAMLQTEFGGMQESLTRLFLVTGDADHLRLARLFDHRAVFDPLARGEDPLDGLHANTQIPKAIGAALDCAATGEGRYCAVAGTFWDRVARRRSYAIGGHSEDEHFPPVTRLSRHLGESTAETCNTYNMLKLTRELFERDADPTRLDFYERGLFNHVLASNDPATGGVTYYVAMKPGAWRTFSTPEDSFWCCVGTGLENPARLGEALYARRGDALLVNLFLASKVAWRERGLTLRQETRFPDEEESRLVLRLESPVRFPLLVRRPSWAGEGFAVSVNGTAVEVVAPPGTYVALDREWNDGDRVEVRLPLRLRFEAFADDPARGAFLAGPIVLAADLGAAGVPAAARYGPPAPEVRVDDLPEPPAFVASGPDEAVRLLEPGGEPLSFRSAGRGRPRDFELVPFFRLHDRRHAVYVDLVGDAAWRERRARAAAEAAREAQDLARRTVDAVQAGVAADEAAHALEQRRSDEWWFEGRRCRSVRSGGSFGYRLKVPASGPVSLRVVYWGGETRRRRFQVLVEDEPVATESLFDDRPGEVLAREYPVPAAVVDGREHVRVVFRPLPGESTGAVFEVRTVRPVSSPPR